MRKFIEMRFFHLPENISRSVTDLPILKRAYEEFVENLFAESEKTDNLTAFYNQLCYLRVELRSRRKSKLFKNKNTQPLINEYNSKALQLVNTQLKLVGWKIRNNNIEQTKRNRFKAKIKWTGSIYEFVEFVYAALAARCFNNGEIDIKELMGALSEVFDFKVKNFYHVYTTIRKRADDRTIFLDKLKEKFMDKMEDADNKKLKRR